MKPQALDDLDNLGGPILARLAQVTSYRRRPAGIVRPPADDVQVKLRHDVADGGKVHLGAAQCFFDKRGDERRVVHDRGAELTGQIEQVVHIRFRHQDEPWDDSVLVQENMRVRRLTR